MSVDFLGKRALVTGAASGIGRGIALQLLKYGAQVVALDKSEENLELLKKEEPSIQTVVADLNDWETTKSVLQAILPIDLLVNNAGIATAEPITEVTEEIFDRVFNVNIKSIFLVTQAIIKDLYQRQASGAIVNISSAAAKGGLPNRTVYCASKGAVDSFTRFANIENVAETVVFLLSDKASMITGSCIPVDGGYLAG